MEWGLIIAEETKAKISRAILVATAPATEKER